MSDNTQDPVVSSTEAEEPKAPVTEEESPITLEDVAPEKLIFSQEISIPSTGDKVVIHKLKAGKFYQARQLFLNWMQKISVMEVLREKNMAGFSDSKGKPDVAKMNANAEDFSKDQADALMQAVEEAERSKMEMMAYCLDMDQAVFGDTFYPEDIAVLLLPIISINGFYSNLKK